MNRFFIISNSVIFRIGMRAMINSVEGYRVMGDGHHLKDLQEWINSNEGQFFIIDLDECDRENLVDIGKCMNVNPTIKMIGISKFSDEEMILMQYKAGVHGLLHISCDIKTLKAAITEINAGGKYYTPTASSIIEKYYNKLDVQFRKAEKNKNFNSKELEIIRLCCQQKTSKEIGKKIFLCEKTVDYHRQKIISKMDVRNMVGMVVYAIKNEMVNLSDI